MKIACILLKTDTAIGDYNANHLERMGNESKHDVDLIVINDPNFQELRKKFNYYKYKCDMGLQFLVVLDFYTRNKEYDYYMFFEEDLVFNSDKNLFDEIKYEYDFIFQNERVLDYYWYWNKPHLNNLSVNGYLPYAGLLNIYLMRPNVVEDLIKFIKDGYYGHYEYVVNTFIMMNQDKYNIGYLSDIFKIFIDYKEIFGKFYDYELVHPVKTLKKYIDLLTE